MALGIFLLGSVSIVGLFVAASVLHADAINRRTASFIGEELLAHVRTMRLRDVFATTDLAAGIGAGDPVIRVGATEATSESGTRGANFHRYPFFPWPFENAESGFAPYGPDRSVGPILIDQELIWYTGRPSGADQFTGCARGLRGDGDGHAEEADILQPRTWYYVLAGPLPAPPAAAPSDTQLSVYGDPSDTTSGHPPPVPTRGYIVLGEEWIRYTGTAWDSATDRGEFSWEDEDASRGAGDTEAVAHPAGTPVSVAYEHPRYPGFYCSVQFYPSNTAGSQARVLIGVGYGTPERFRLHSFHTIFTPTLF